MTLKSRFIAVFAGLRSFAADIIPPNPFALIVTALAFIMVGGVCAFAQDGSTPVVAASFTGTLANIRDIVESFGIIVGCVFALLTATPFVNGVISVLGSKDAAQRAQLETLFKDRLHAAVQNAIQYAVTKSGLPISAVTVATILADAVAYLQDKNPDTIAFFKLEVRQLEDLVTANWPNVFSWLKGSDLPSTLVAGVTASVDTSAPAGAVYSDMQKALQEYDASLPSKVAAINAVRNP